MQGTPLGKMIYSLVNAVCSYSFYFMSRRLSTHDNDMKQVLVIFLVLTNKYKSSYYVSSSEPKCYSLGLTPLLLLTNEHSCSSHSVSSLNQ